MKYSLTIRAKNEPIALERILQVTRYRGFQLIGLQMHTEDSQSMVICVKVETDKTVSLLTTQLEKIYEVMSIAYTQQTESEAVISTPHEFSTASPLSHIRSAAR